MAENERHAYLATTKAIIGWSVASRIDSIDVPVLVVAADGDYTSVASKEAYARRMKRARVEVVSDARHAFPVEDPARFNAIVGRFIDERGLVEHGV